MTIRHDGALLFWQRPANIFVNFLCLSGQCLVVLARKDGDLAFVGHFEPDGHDTFLLVVNVVAIADRNDGDRSGVLDEDSAPIANPKPATVAALEPQQQRFTGDSRARNRYFTAVFR
jgi:hypothetical protein